MKKERPLVKVTENELLNVLNTIEKGTFVFCVFETDKRMLKGGRENTNEYYGRVRKRTSGIFQVGNSYYDRISNELSKIGKDPESFEKVENKVGEHVSKCVLFNEKTQSHYFQMEYHKEIKYKPRNVYMLDGEVMDLSDPIKKQIFDNFKQYFVESSVSKKQEVHGIPQSVVTFSPKVSNIKRMTINKVKYLVTED
jgi:hypothetical protein